jgi:hypothetical protein
MGREREVSMRLKDDQAQAGWCTEHNDLAWLYDDGSVGCYYACVVETSDAGCKVTPFPKVVQTWIANRREANTDGK